MGYDASSYETDFVVPPDNVEAALAAINADRYLRNPNEPYTSITEAVEDHSGFMECIEDGEDGFILGYHSDRYLSSTDAVLELLARFAVEGSYARFLGQDDAFFGFRVVGGRLCSEHADLTWHLDRPTLREFVKAYEAYDGDRRSAFIHIWQTFILSGTDLAYYCPTAPTGLHLVTSGKCELCGSQGGPHSLLFANPKSVGGPK